MRRKYESELTNEEWKAIEPRLRNKWKLRQKCNVEKTETGKCSIVQNKNGVSMAISAEKLW